MLHSVRFIAGLATLVLAAPALAQFNPGPNPITSEQNAQRTLTSGTGIIDSTGAIRILSGSTVPLLMSGNSSLLNNGTIETLGTGRAIDSNSGVANLTITNNGLIRSQSTDAFRVNTASSSVLLNNSGNIQVLNGGQAIDWAAITTGSNQLNNGANGSIYAFGEDAIRMGRNGRVENAGAITADLSFNAAGEAAGGDGIDLRTNTGVVIVNSGDIFGRHGIATDGTNGPPFLVTITNQAGGSINGGNGSGINIDGVSANVVANIINDGLIMGFVDERAMVGDGDGIDVDGVIHLTNNGGIEGQGAIGAGNSIEGIAAGGGSIVNNLNGYIGAVQRSGSSSAAANGILIDDSNGGSAVAATSIQNFGAIFGSGFGVRIVGDFADTITNEASGSITGGTSSIATIDTGGGNDTLVNRGYLQNVAGRSVDLGAGDDQMIIEGPSANVQGDMSGGTGTDSLVMNPGSTGDLLVTGVISDFERVEVQSGSVSLLAQNTYAGATVLSGGTLNLHGANRLNTASHLEIGDAALRLLSAEGPDGQTLGGLSLLGNATLDLGLSSITFELLDAVSSGASLSILGWTSDTSPGYAIRFAGDLTSSSLFLALVDATTINGLQAGFSFDGAFTNVTSPVPLPAAVWMLASGLGVLGAARRRSRVSPAGNMTVIRV